MIRWLTIIPSIGLLVALAINLGQSPHPQGARLDQGDTALQDGPGQNAHSRTDGDKKMVKVSVFNSEGELVGPIEMPRVVKSEAEWKAILTPEQFRVARASGTERPFCGTLLDNKLEGVYTCICCKLPLFTSQSKFNSGTGWPSFFQPIADHNVSTKEDNSHGMQRIEILCARCDCHLGHVFNDGPRPTGLRFCVNSESLQFTAADELKTLAEK